MIKKAINTYEAAEYCQVTPRTMIQWINEGKLKAYRTPGNHNRIQIEDFIDFLKRYNMPIPSEFTSEKGDRKRVLIVDDDKRMIDAIQRVLKREKMYDLEIAYDGFEAGEKFSDFKPDLIVLDIRIPGLDGYKLCSHIRSDFKNEKIKILLISGNIGPNEIQQIKKSGADDYLEKPFKNHTLKEKIEELLVKGIPS